MQTELYWIEGTWPGRLAIMPRPRGDDWLEDEIEAWRRAEVDVVCSLLTPDEIDELSLSEEATLCQNHDVEFVSFPIEDREVPASTEGFAELVALLSERLREGKNLAVHCRQGIGRAALLAIALLVCSGESLADAVDKVGTARGCSVPETSEQERWLEAYAERARRAD